jgi:hypothetical protein
MATTTDTTIRTSAADALTDIQIARRAVEAAVMRHNSQHTKETKLALKEAQAKEQKLTLDYFNWRMARYQAECEKQRTS